MEGYVLKWVNFIQGWKLRYLILQDNQLICRTTKEGENKKIINMMTVRVIDEKKKKHFLIEKEDKKMYYFKTNTEEEKKAWIIKLIEAMSRKSMARDDLNKNRNTMTKENSLINNCPKNTAGNEVFSKFEMKTGSLSLHPTGSYSVEEENNIEVEKIDDYLHKMDNNLKPLKNKRFSKDYNTYYQEINKNKNKENFSKFDKIINNYQNLTNLFFEFSNEMENFNFHLINQKSKSKEEYTKVYQSLYSIRHEMKEQLDNIMSSLMEYKEEKEGVKNIKSSEDVIKPMNETFYCAEDDENEPTNQKNSENNYFQCDDLMKSDTKIEIRCSDLQDCVIEDNDSSFEDCISYCENNKNLDKDFQASFEDSILKESTRNKAKFTRSLSMINGDFSNPSYDFAPRRQLPFSIKCSNSMVTDMLKSLTKEKIALPLHYNEPISMLQRVSEKFQYSDLLSKAATTPKMKLAYISSFIVAELSLNINRILKPFNPILGETFEYFDNNLKYRYFSEQVSHNPPISAFICESEDFAVFGDTRCKSQFKFLKGAIEVVFNNKTNILFKNTNEHITYNKPTLFLKGLIMGSPHYDFSGVVKIEDVNNKEVSAVIDFFEEGRKSKPLGHFEGKILDSNGKEAYLIGGNWINSPHVFITDWDGAHKVEIWRMNDETVIKNKDLVNNYLIPPYSCNLNYIPSESESNLTDKLPPTDSRLRPDQRAYELRDLQLAEKEKLRIEQKQRNRHKEFEKAMVKYEPNYFAEVLDSRTGEYIYLYKGDYWSDRKINNFSHLYDVFSP